jgi:hypothetical protein
MMPPIATISLVRNEQEEATLRSSLTALAALGVPVFIADGGSPESFLQFLQSFPHFTVLSAKGLWPQAKTSIEAAANAGAEWVVYTEPDKQSFFENDLLHLAAKAERSGDTGIVIASRSEKAYASFPAFQQMTEQTINQCCQEVTGLAADYCYGPFLFRAALVKTLSVLPENCGWGWRPFLFASASLSGYTLQTFEGDFLCPPAQATDDATERRYRMKQMVQNIEGLLLATSAPA